MRKCSAHHVFIATGFISSWQRRTPTYFLVESPLDLAYLFPSSSPVRGERGGWRRKTGCVTAEVKNRLKCTHTYGSEMYLTGHLSQHTENTYSPHTYTRELYLCQPLFQAQHLVQKALTAGGEWGWGRDASRGRGGRRGDRWERAGDSDDTQFWMSPWC